jgi:trimethylguanosine synthase
MNQEDVVMEEHPFVGVDQENDNKEEEEDTSQPVPTTPAVETNASYDFELVKSRIEKSYKQISISRKMRKFYRRRYQLFKRFDDGILLDKESWYSVTPEVIAQHIAQKCHTKMNSRSDLTILDGFCGSGGNTIQFARYFDHVLACDIDFVKLQCAQHNARIYEQEAKVSFLMQDFFRLHETLPCGFSIDLIFLSPPWGGLN